MTAKDQSYAPLDVVVLTHRPDVARRIREISRVLKTRGIHVRLVEDIDEALDLGESTLGSLLIFDFGVDPHAVGQIPRLWCESDETKRVVLITESNDAMFRRSAIRSGFADCLPLERLLHPEILLRLATKPRREKPEIEYEDAFRSHFAESRDAIFVVDGEGRGAFANRRFFSSVGLLPASPKTFSLTTFFPELGSAYLQRLSPPTRAILELRRASGNVDIVDVEFSYVKLEERPFLVLRF